MQALFAGGEAGAIGKITRAGEETKLTPDAMPENAAGKEEARGTIGRRGTRGMEAGRRVGLLRGARAIIVRRGKKFWIPERGVANTCLDEHRRCARGQRNVSSKGISRS